MNSIFKKLRIILYERFSFHYDQIQLETQLELELGMDSRGMFELFDELEKNFNITFDFNEIDDILKDSEPLTIQNLTNYLEKKQVSE